MQRTLGSDDFLARLGGDEFGVLIPDCSLQQAQEITGELVQAVSRYVFKWKNGTHPIGARPGITLLDGSNSNISEIMSQVELACYNTRHNGRGQLSVFPNRLIKNGKSRRSAFLSLHEHHLLWR
ncbi:hypothetical protein SY86_06325 [Erwinia tracheiphila]|uniref:GGDEF domain-containing protein n=1 Tax=Erwinia tracheiphila TaxID=65700 RepID=A0A0M2KCW9_9GAMM|nr:sensor-type protein [Erwinia tracheiphila PSU-1]KKF35132.1 hypothetical protein SY86_06325 [Erwinia tracheiphila]